MECKTAYQTLVDEQQRRQYDRTLDVGSTCQRKAAGFPRTTDDER